MVYTSFIFLPKKTVDTQISKAQDTSSMMGQIEKGKWKLKKKILFFYEIMAGILFPLTLIAAEREWFFFLFSFFSNSTYPCAL